MSPTKILTIALASLLLAFSVACDPDEVPEGGEAAAIEQALDINLTSAEHRIQRLEFVVELQARQIAAQADEMYAQEGSAADDTQTEAITMLLSCLSEATWQKYPCWSQYGLWPTQAD